MAEVQSNVYDLVFPSPPTLKEIIPISIAVQLWHQEINTHRMKNTLNQLDLKQYILSSNSSPRIPSSILSQIETAVNQFGLSIQGWLLHHQKLFKNEIFNDFIDFVGDFDCSIHYVRTAKRLVLCDQIDQILRFKIACAYCFEDDILRIWPLVSAHLDLRDISFYEYPTLFYWICQLQHQLYKLPRSHANNYNQSIEERILLNYSHDSWTCVVYFWNRLDFESRMRIATCHAHILGQNFAKIFSRYLAKTFDEVQLDQIANTSGWQIIATLLHKVLRKKGNESLYALSIWNYLKNKINGDKFIILIRKIINDLCAVCQSHGHYETLGDISSYEELCASTPDQLRQQAIQAIDISASAYTELCASTPDLMKQQAIQAILLDHSLFEIPNYVQYSGHPASGSVLFKFLFTLLTDAAIEDRSKFWNTFWSRLLPLLGTAQFDQLMTLCFNNDETEIVKFKLNSMSKMQNVRKKCLILLKNRYFEELNDFLKLCFPDEKRRRKIRFRLLKDFNVGNEDVTNPFPLNDFINDACDDVNAAAVFRTKLLMSSPSTVTALKSACYRTNFYQALRFIDALAPTQQVASDCKRLHVFPIFEQKLRTDYCLLHFEEHQLSNFLLECLGNDDEITRFKQTFNVDEVVQCVIRSALPKTVILKYNPFLAEFLEWYFDTPEALEEFQSRYANDNVFVQLTNKSE
ncbi:uncharacterized protein LOC135840818 isoform X1 [Planococcus citri]|uniref:uncharacterized protein LOC135840818 isoform X1 n=1 Tax=Planococcus citri TaxID=170843 RepID=UPI0031F8E0D4